MRDKNSIEKLNHNYIKIQISYAENAVDGFVLSLSPLNQFTTEDEEIIILEMGKYLSLDDSTLPKSILLSYNKIEQLKQIPELEVEEYELDGEYIWIRMPLNNNNDIIKFINHLK